MKHVPAIERHNITHLAPFWRKQIEIESCTIIGLTTNANYNIPFAITSSPQRPQTLSAATQTARRSLRKTR